MPSSVPSASSENVFLQGLAPKELCRRLAGCARKARTEHQMSQAEFARACHISLRTYKRFESTGQASLENFVRVVTVLQRVTALGLLFPPPPSSGLSPLERQLERIRVRTTIQALAEGQGKKFGADVGS